MSPIDQAREHLTEPRSVQNPWMTLLAAAFCALSAVLLAGAMLFGQLN
ncbi:MAG TPA: hypothetical protein PLE81_11355 [Brevundimonas sp.]|jgi:hypothetical protein|nr:hypothetical protein [Brevundimonas sp.]HRH21218.1 hypothetical protein [Brevundimonas sp.]